MRKPVVMLVVAVGAVISMVSPATAQERCMARYRFSWGQDVQGSISARAGTPCRVPLNMRLGPIASAEIVRAPSNASASVVSTYGLVLNPKPGFKGQDSMVVRYRGGQTGTRQASVTFAITVY